MCSCPTDLLIEDRYVATRLTCGNKFRIVALISIHITYNSLQ